MIINKIIGGGGYIYLRSIDLNDCTERYVEWLNDPDITRYLETRWYDQNLDSIKEFVKSQIENKNSYLFAIIKTDTNQHIGNIKLGPINQHHNHADISYFIGEKTLWQKGIATEAVRLICEFGFEELKLHRIEAGTYSTAIGSWHILEKVGFKREGVFRNQVMSEGNYIDVFRYGILKDEFNNR